MAKGEFCQDDWLQGKSHENPVAVRLYVCRFRHSIQKINFHEFVYLQVYSSLKSLEKLPLMSGGCTTENGGKT